MQSTRGDRCLIRFLLAATCAASIMLGGVAEAKPQKCKTKACHTRVLTKHWKRVTAPYWRAFERIAHCESTGRWHLEAGNGYSGGLQFIQSSWYAVGGTGRPAQASKLEQIYRGTLLMKRGGWGNWPVCRRVAGV